MQAVPQFGVRLSDRVYVDRPAAFGIASHDGLIAIVRVAPEGFVPWIDLPGGGIDPGEGAVEAVVREFGEETGLRIAAGDLLGQADQFFVDTAGRSFNNRQTLFAVTVEAEAPALKVEHDHTLVWIEPHEAVARLRHESHAWAVTAWLRRK